MFDGYLQKLLPLSKEAIEPILYWAAGYPWSEINKSNLIQFDGSFHVEHVGYFPSMHNPELFAACGIAIRELQSLSWLAACDPVYLIAAKLKAGAVVNTHYDVRKRHELSHRIHIPLSNCREAQYLFSSAAVNPSPGERLIPYLNEIQLDESFQMEFGNAYLFNNRCLHQVRHTGHIERTNVFIDFLPNEYRLLTGTQLEEKQPQTERERLCLSMS